MNSIESSKINKYLQQNTNSIVNPARTKNQPTNTISLKSYNSESKSQYQNKIEALQKTKKENSSNNFTKTLSSKHKTTYSTDYENLGTQIYKQNQVITTSNYNKNNYITCPTNELLTHIQTDSAKNKGGINYKPSFNQVSHLSKEKSRISNNNSNKLQLHNYKSTSPETKTPINFTGHLRNKSSTSRYEIKSRDKPENFYKIDNANGNGNNLKRNDYGIIGNLNINIHNNFNINGNNLAIQPIQKTDQIYIDKTPNSNKVKINSLNKNELKYIQEQLIKKLKTSQNEFVKLNSSKILFKHLN